MLKEEQNILSICTEHSQEITLAMNCEFAVVIKKGQYVQ